MKKLILFLLITKAASAGPQISIYYSLPTKPLGNKVIQDGQDVASSWMRLLLRSAQSHKNAYSTLKKVSDFYQNAFGLQSYDGKNSEIIAIVGFARIPLFPGIKELKQNAAWYDEGKAFLVGSGGSMLDNFEKEVDVMAHEYTHAVVDSSSRLELNGQSGALNESLADIFGELAEVKINGSQGPRWIIGENILTPRAKTYFQRTQNRIIVGLRDMLNPENGVEPQPKHMIEIPLKYGTGCVPTVENDHCGVHVLSGIPNRAAALSVEKLGWEKMAPLFYEVMTKKLNSKSQFKDFANETLRSCADRLSSEECSHVAAAFSEVGL